MAALVLDPTTFAPDSPGGELLTTLVSLDAAVLLALSIARAKGRAGMVGALGTVLVLVVGLGCGFIALLAGDPRLTNVLVVPLAAATGAGFVASVWLLVREIVSGTGKPAATDANRASSGQVQETTVAGNRVEGDMRVEPRQRQ